MIFFIINHTSIKLGRKVSISEYEKKISQTLEFFYLYKKKKMLTGQKEMPNVTVVQLPLSL